MSRTRVADETKPWPSIESVGALPPQHRYRMRNTHPDVERLHHRLLDVGWAPCVGDPRWTSDEADERREAAEECVACPVLAECEAAATAHKPTHGVWAGKDRTVIPRSGPLTETERRRRERQRRDKQLKPRQERKRAMNEAKDAAKKRGITPMTKAAYEAMRTRYPNASRFHDWNDPQSYLSAIEANWLAAQMPACVMCREKPQAEPSAGTAWSVMNVHAGWCPEDDDD